MEKETEKELKLSLTDTLDVAVNKLLEARANGQHVYCVFNGVTLHSDDVTMNSAYRKVVGCSKKKAEQRSQEVLDSFREEERLEREKARAKIPSWIERGKELIYPERYEAWENYVIRSVNSRFAGAEIEDALRIMAALEEGATMEEIKQSFKSDGALAARGVIFSFSKRGPEFLEAVMYPTEGFRIPEIEAKRRENEELARINAEKNESTGKHV